MFEFNPTSSMKRHLHPSARSGVAATELALILNVEKEKEIELMDWMVSFEEFNLSAMIEPEIGLEDWMLNFEPVPDYAFEALASEEGISMNLKPYASEWIYDFQTWGYTDFRIRF